MIIFGRKGTHNTRNKHIIFNFDNIFSKKIVLYMIICYLCTVFIKQRRHKYINIINVFTIVLV